MPWYDYFLKKKEEQDKEKEQDPSATFSVSGTEIYSGYIQEEFLGELISMRSRYNIYDKMWRSSGVINMCVNAVMYPIESAKWGFRIKENYVDDPKAQAQLDFIEKAFEKDALSKLVSDMCLATLFGFSVHEKYYLPFDYEGSMKLMTRLKYISPRTVKRWIIDQESNWIGIEQEAYGDTANDLKIYQREISSKHLVHFAIKKVGDNYEGISFLRTCYGNYVRKNVNFKNIAIGNRFLAIPFLKIYSENQSLRPRDQKEFENRLRSRSRGDRSVLSHILFPPGFTAEEQQTAFDPIKMYECNDKENEEIIRNFSCNFLLLTRGAGSFALSDTLANFFTQGLESIGRKMETVIDQSVVKDSIMMNFDEECMVECFHSEIGNRGGEKLAKALSSLVNSKILRMDDPLEEWTREKFSMPKPDEATRREEQIDPMGFGGGGGNNNPQGDNDDDEDKEEKEIELADSGRSKMINQAKGSYRRIKSMQKKTVDLIQAGLTEISEKKIKKLVAHYKKNIANKKKENVRPDFIKISDSKIRKSLTSFFAEEVGAEIKSIQTQMSLATDEKDVLRITSMLVASDTTNAIAGLDTSILYTYMDNVIAGATVQELDIALHGASKKYIEGKDVIGKGTVLPAKAVNIARKTVFDKEYKDIESYTFYNPDPQARVCVELAGQTAKAGDPILKLYQPPLHYNCATVIFPNLKRFKGNPKPKRLKVSSKGEESINIGVKTDLL